jgi:hypothetical protein
MNGPVEPNAELRQMAANLFEIYSALVQAGFSADQALQIVALMIIQNK